MPNLIGVILTVLMLVLAETLPAIHKKREPYAQRGNYFLTEMDEPPSDQQIIQSILEGIFAENKLQGPFMVKYCFTPQIAHQTVSFLNDALPQASKASATSLIELILQTKVFVDSLPFSFLLCLGQQEEIRTLGEKFDIDAGTDFVAVEKKISQYVALHYLTVHRWAVDENQRWQNGLYYDTGYYGSMYGHKVQYWKTKSDQ